MTAEPERLALPRRHTTQAGVRGRRRPALVLAGLAVALGVVAVLAIAVGEEYISPAEVVGMALQWLPIHPARTWSDTDLTIITLLRLPRILAAVMVGSALAATGAAFQALFRNPLADPGIVGTSAGATMGAVIALIVPLQIAWLGFSLVQVAAFGGALGATVFVYALARVGGRVPSTSLLLAGFAVSAILNAGAALVETLSDRLREIYLWLLGSLAFTTPEQLLVAAPLLFVGVLGLLALARDLDVLALGDEQAQYLGLRVARRRLLVLVLGSLLTSVAVALSGLVALVGLLVPHITRLLVGANHRILLPASLLMGSIFLVIVDAVARLVLAPQELPIGLITALLGGSWFITLLRRKKGEYVF